MSWKPVYGLLILAMTLANYLFGLAIVKSSKRKAKLFLTLGIAFNLLLLGIFKYAYFTWDLAAQSLKALGGTLMPCPWQIILPLGISFFVFEFIHYIVDVYKGHAPVRSFV